jgi:hypothetical protein
VLQQIFIGRKHGGSLGVDVLHRAESIFLIAAHGDRVVGARNLEDVEAVVCCRYELGQGWVVEDGIVGQRDVGDVKVEAFRSVDVL